jgi:hypothetical protein
VCPGRRTHKAKRITAPWGQRVYIDAGIVELIQLVWKLGIATAYSCEELHDGLAQISVYNEDDAALLFLAATGDDLGLSHVPDAAKDPRYTLRHARHRWELSWNPYGVIHCMFPAKSLSKVTRSVARFQSQLLAEEAAA